jgi:S-DNA-T family DNA segregation ATPase FtsK/SpoIIIE
VATTPSHRQREAAGVALLALALFLALAIASSTSGLGGACHQTRSLMGPVGACARAGLVWLVGVPAAFLVPLLPAIHALRLFGRMQSDTDRNWLLFVLGMVLLVPVTIALAMHVGHTWSDYSGFWGGFFAFYLSQALLWGAWIFIALAFSALTIFTLAWNPVRVLLGVEPRTALRLPWRRVGGIGIGDGRERADARGDARDRAVLTGVARRRFGDRRFAARAAPQEVQGRDDGRAR